MRWLDRADRLREPIEVLEALRSLLDLLGQCDKILASLTVDKLDDGGIDFLVEFVTISLTDNARVLSMRDMKHCLKFSLTPLGSDTSFCYLTLIGLHLQ